MFCRQCGNKMKDGETFCDECGAMVRLTERFVSKERQTPPYLAQTPSNSSNTSGKSEKKRNRSKPSGIKNSKSAKTPTKKKKRWIFPVIISVILVAVVTAICFFVDPLGFFVGTEDKETGLYHVTPPDADEYFENNGTIIAEYEINDSKKVHTEAETYKNFIERGFTENPITTEYGMDGKYYKAIEISNSSSSKHPIYQTFYISANGEIWSILEINGAIMANPLSNNDQSGAGGLVVISETKIITSYDSTKNKFYETIPNESMLRVRTVDRIDTETLDSLTIGGVL